MDVSVTPISAKGADNKMAESNNVQKTLEKLTFASKIKSHSQTARISKQALKNFTIPKIRRADNKAHLEPCLTDRREYNDITTALNKLRLDLNSDLQTSWQFGDIKLVYNDDLERKFAAKRSEMREGGRHMRELQEHFCFLVLPNTAILEIYQNGIRADGSAMQALGNPLLGVYLYKHIDVALKYAHHKSMKVDNIMIFKVLYGKVKKIPPAVEKKKKYSLDPTPNFDCHVSRNPPSPKELIEQQAIGSSVYLYEYDQESKPVEKPRQCLPYAVVTARFKGQKSGSVPFITSLRFQSKFLAGQGSLKNCTVAKRIGKGKDATIIYESIRKPTSVPATKSLAGCPGKIPDSQKTQDEALLSTECTERTEKIENWQKILQTNPIYQIIAACVSDPSSLSGHMQNRSSCSVKQHVHMEMLGCVTSKENSHLTDHTTAVPTSVSSSGSQSSTVITSKLIRDPRLLRREWNTDNQITEIPSIWSFPSENGPEFLNLAVKTHASLDTQCSVPANPSLHNDTKQGLFTENVSTGKLENQESPHKEEAEVSGKDYSGEMKLEVDRAQKRMKSINIPFSKVKGLSTSEVYFPENQLSPHVNKGLFFEDLKMHESQLKLKLMKHSSLLVLSDKDRKSKIDSVESLSKDEKRKLFHRLKCYEKYYKKYEKDLGIYNKKNKLLVNKRPSGGNYQSPTSLKEATNAIKTSDSSMSHYRSACEASSEVVTADTAVRSNCLGSQLNIYSTPVVEISLGDKSPLLTQTLQSYSTSASIPSEDQNKEQNKIDTSPFPVFICSDNTNSARCNKDIIVNNETNSGPVSTEFLMHGEGDVQAVRSVELSTGAVCVLGLSAEKEESMCHARTILKPQIGKVPKERQRWFSEKTVPKETKGTSKGNETPGQSAVEADNTAKDSSPLKEDCSFIDDSFVQSSTDFCTDNCILTLPEREFENKGKITESTENTLGPAAVTLFLKKMNSILNTKVTKPSKNEEDEICSDGISSKLKSINCQIGAENGNFSKNLEQVLSCDEADHNRGHPEASITSETTPDGIQRKVEISQLEERKDDMVFLSTEICVNVSAVSVDISKERNSPDDKEEKNDLPMGKQHYLDGIDVSAAVDEFDFGNEQLIKKMPDDDNVMWFSTVRQNAHLAMKMNAHCKDDSIQLADDLEYLKSNETAQVTGSERTTSNFLSIYDQRGISPEKCLVFRDSKKAEMMATQKVTMERLLKSEFNRPVVPSGSNTNKDENSLNLFYSIPTFNVDTDHEALEASETVKTDGIRNDHISLLVENMCHCKDIMQDISEQSFGHDEENWEQRFLQNLEVETVIEISPVNCFREDRVSGTEKKCISGDPLHFHILKDRIDWENLFGKSGDLCLVTDSNNFLYTWMRRNEMEPSGMRVFPDLQVMLSNEPQSHLSPAQQNLLHLRKEFLRCSSKPIRPSMEKEFNRVQLVEKHAEVSYEHDTPVLKGMPVNKLTKESEQQESFGIHGKEHMRRLSSKRTSEAMEELTINAATRIPDGSCPRNSMKEIDMNCVPEKKGYVTLNPGLDSFSAGAKAESRSVNATPKDGHRQAEGLHCTVPKVVKRIPSSVVVFHSKKFQKDTRRRRLVQRNSQTCERAKRMNSNGSTEIFGSLSAGRIKTFSQSEKHIKNVLSTLSDEVSLCKSKRLSKKLDRAISHLRKAQKRVQRSLQLVAKVGVQRKGPLPKSYKVVCNNLWESCDLVKDNFTKLRKFRSVRQNATDLSKMKYMAISNTEDHMKMSDPPDCTIHTNHTTDLLDDIANRVDYQESTSDSVPCLFSLAEHKLACMSGDHDDVEKSANILEKLPSVPEIPASESYSQVADIMLLDKETEHNVSSLKSSTEEVSGNDNNIKNSTESKTEHNSLSSSPISVTRSARDNIYAEENTTFLVSVAEKKECSVKNIVSPNHLVPAPPDVNECRTKKKSGLSGRKGETSTQMEHVQDIPTESCSPCMLNSGSLNKSASLIAELSNILQKADETSSLEILQEQIIICETILPTFIKVFEKKQQCSFQDVLVYRKLLFKRNLQFSFRSKLKPQAVDSFLDLQMMMETIQFIENRISCLEGEPTFRSMLWYDDTLYSQLLGGESGYQQQSNFYLAFQERLKYHTATELQSYYTRIYAFLDGINERNSSYYVFLKYRREVNECKAVLRQCDDYLDFSLSVPFTCGVNLGDSLEDLETLRNSIVELTKTYINLPKLHCDPGKQEHVWVLLEFISAKIVCIKNSASMSDLSLYGLEHLFFDAAKDLMWQDHKQSSRGKTTESARKGFILKLNNFALSKLYEVFGCLDDESNFENEIEPAYKLSSSNSLCIYRTKAFCVGEILDAATSADLDTLQQLTLRCTDQLETLKQYFQILQENDVDSILITEENVLESMQRHSKATSLLLKPEAVETYIEMAMIYETVYFLKNSIATSKGDERFRSMLWFDLSLFPELVRCQEKIASFYFLKAKSGDDILKAVDSAISELKAELEIISEYNESVNCSYALLLLARELAELSELRELLLKSKSAIPAFVDCVPYIATVNYGSTESELEYSYNHFAMLMESLMLAPKKDLGKMAHVMKVMKSIEHLKCARAKHGSWEFSVLTLQMLENESKRCRLPKTEHIRVQKTELGGSDHKTSLRNGDSGMSAKLVARTGVSQSPRKRPAYKSGGGSILGNAISTMHSSSKKSKFADVSINEPTKSEDEELVCINERVKESTYPESGSHMDRTDDLKCKKMSMNMKESKVHSHNPPSQLKDLKNLFHTKMFTSSQKGLPDAVQNVVDPNAKRAKSCKDGKRSGLELASFSIGQSKEMFLSKEHITPLQCLGNLLDSARESATTTQFAKPGVGSMNNMSANGSQYCRPHFQPEDQAENNCYSLKSEIKSSRNVFVFGLENKPDAIEPLDDMMDLDDDYSPTDSPKDYEDDESEKAERTGLNEEKKHGHGSENNVPSNTDSEKEKPVKNIVISSSVSVCISNPSGKQTTQSMGSWTGLKSVEQSSDPGLISSHNELLQATTQAQGSYTNMYNASFPYYFWQLYRQSSYGAHSVTQSYEGTTYQPQSTSFNMSPMTTSNLQNMHPVNLYYSQAINYSSSPGEQQANTVSQMLAMYGCLNACIPFPNYPPPFASNQPSSQTTFPYSDNTGGVWSTTPWQ